MLTDEEIAAFRTRLEAALAALAEEEALGRDVQKVVTLDQQAVGRLSRMDALQNQAMAVAQAGRRSGEERMLRAALDRIATGEFGYCTECGDEIGIRRLAVDTALPRCLSCTRG